MAPIVRLSSITLDYARGRGASLHGLWVCAAQRIGFSTVSVIILNSSLDLSTFFRVGEIADFGHK